MNWERKQIGKKDQNLSLLIVDDKKVFRNVLKKILGEYRQFGEIVEAANADQIFTKLDNNGFTPDVIFMDESLPGLNGFEATRRLLKTHKSTKVILVSSYDTLEYRALAKEAGASAYIVKRNLIEELDSALESILSPQS